MPVFFFAFDLLLDIRTRGSRICPFAVFIEISILFEDEEYGEYRGDRDYIVEKLIECLFSHICVDIEE